MSGARIEVSDQPQKLTDLEHLCLVAREKGFPDDAWVSLVDNRRISVIYTVFPEDAR